jgi:hypothetical protein
MLSGQIVPKRASSAVDAFVTKGQLPAVLLGCLNLLVTQKRGRRRTIGGSVTPTKDGTWGR